MVPNAAPLPIFERTQELLTWLFPTLDHFPKKTRFTLVTRIQNLALDLLDDLTIAAWTHDKAEVLRRANLRLTRLRVMLRVARDLGHLAARQHEHGARELDTIGRMLGGWQRSLGARVAPPGPGG